MALAIHNICEWEEHVLKRSDGRYILVSFSASWCGACKRMQPVFEDMANRNNAVVFVTVDVVELEPVARASHVAALPAYQVWKDGGMVEKFEGSDETKLSILVDKYNGISRARNM